MTARHSMLTIITITYFKIFILNQSFDNLTPISLYSKLKSSYWVVFDITVTLRKIEYQSIKKTKCRLAVIDMARAEK